MVIDNVPVPWDHHSCVWRPYATVVNLCDRNPPDDQFPRAVMLRAVRMAVALEREQQPPDDIHDLWDSLRRIGGHRL